ISSRSSASASLTTPSATASATPPATPACAAPQVSTPCSSPAIDALLTNRVSGLAGRPGRTTATNAAFPRRGVASAVAQATPTGPSRRPRMVLTCAASAPSPTKLSPISNSAPRERRVAHRVQPAGAVAGEPERLEQRLRLAQQLLRDERAPAPPLLTVAGGRGYLRGLAGGGEHRGAVPRGRPQSPPPPVPVQGAPLLPTPQALT